MESIQRNVLKQLPALAMLAVLAGCEPSDPVQRVPAVLDNEAVERITQSFVEPVGEILDQGMANVPVLTDRELKHQLFAQTLTEVTPGQLTRRHGTEKWYLELLDKEGDRVAMGELGLLPVVMGQSERFGTLVKSHAGILYLKQDV